MKKILTILLILISISGFSQTSKMDSLIARRDSLIRSNPDSAKRANWSKNRENLKSKQSTENEEMYKNMDSTKNMAVNDWNMINETAKKIGWKKTIQAYSDIFFPIAGVIILLLLWLRGKKS